VRQWQLRTYRVQPGELEQWIEEWRATIKPLRETTGFEVLGPWVGEGDLFVWLIGHDDFDAADAAYHASPERAALDPDPARLLADIQTVMLEAR